MAWRNRSERYLRASERHARVDFQPENSSHVVYAHLVAIYTLLAVNLPMN